MRLKHYQEKVINELKAYLSALAEARQKYENVLQLDPELAGDIHFPKSAWTKATGRELYHAKVNGLGEPVPDIYLKVPTGGGKTFLACHAIDHIHSTYLKRQAGLVLWVVPSTQIYRQTILALKDRTHPYRQLLDMASGGRTLIKEKSEVFTPADAAENLMVLMLMLPSANRQNKETLRMFRDSGGFTGFFPPEDQYEAHKELKKHIPNLDTFSDENTFFTQVKTSLGNTLKLLRPLVIIDEGHRAYGELARQTIRDFNPSFILELSATPPQGSNELVKITGRELHEEEMIKLDIHLTNKGSLDWQDTMLASIEKRNALEEAAKSHEGNTGTYIRPICLVQVERTGRDQRDSHYIHAEDVKEFLMTKCGIAEGAIAIKSSEKDDIEGIDLLSRDCEIRYIITKQALQEGWDCPFAYLLTILTDPSSATGITQLVGRILRQPYAQKTKVTALDECYVYTFRQNAATLVRQIKSGLEGEGLGDIAGRIVSDEGADNPEELKLREPGYRENFKKFEGKIYLPRFVVQEETMWRDVIFEADILSRIDWDEIDLSPLNELVLQARKNKEQEIALGLNASDEDWLAETGRLEQVSRNEIDEVFLTRHISDIVPNPWHGMRLGHQALEMLIGRYSRELVAANFVFIIEELKKLLDKERNRLAEQVFRGLVEERKLCFFLTTNEGGVLPPRIKVRSNKMLNRADGSQIQKSLFDYVPEENINDLERAVALYLDEQEKLLWWYRNMSKQDYHIQGWKRNKIFPDFIAAGQSATTSDDYQTVYVLESKGLHLKNEDTTYKQDVFALCRELGAKKDWKELFDEFPDHDFEFQVVFEDEWQRSLNRLFDT